MYIKSSYNRNGRTDFLLRIIEFLDGTIRNHRNEVKIDRTILT